MNRVLLCQDPLLNVRVRLLLGAEAICVIVSPGPKPVPEPKGASHPFVFLTGARGLVMTIDCKAFDLAIVVAINGPAQVVLTTRTNTVQTVTPCLSLLSDP